VPESKTPTIRGRSGSFRMKNLWKIRFLLASASPRPYPCLVGTLIRMKIILDNYFGKVNLSPNGEFPA
jgi:hypothetical protein